MLLVAYCACPLAYMNLGFIDGLLVELELRLAGVLDMDRAGAGLQIHSAIGGADNLAGQGFGAMQTRVVALQEGGECEEGNQDAGHNCLKCKGGSEDRLGNSYRRTRNGRGRH